MGSLSTLSLPIVKFSGENLESGATTGDLRRALEEYGGFELVCDDDKVTAELHKAMLGLLEYLFDLPLEKKQQNTSVNSLPGYVGPNPQNPLYEGMGIADPTRLESIQGFTNLMWSEGKSSSREIMHSYTVKVSELTKMVTKLVLESFGVEKYYASIVESINYNFRVMRYTAPMTEEIVPAAMTHTDKGFCTILQQNHIDGLEIQTKNGEWIRVSTSPSSFIFMVGDQLYAWTNGRVHCPQHRVTMKGNEARYSMGLFAFNTGVIQCPKELVDGKQP